MKKVLIAIALAVVITAVAAPVVFARELSWGQIKCEFNPRCK